MELPQLGLQCDDSTCKQLDFLPFKCKCGKIFCSDHFKLHPESCPKIKNNKGVEFKKNDGLYVCSHEECKVTSVIQIVCEKCRRNYCLQHRHIIDCFAKSSEEISAQKEKYATPVSQFNKAKAAVDSTLQENLEKAKKKPKTAETANKIQLMRIKNKATGPKTISPIDRVYFNVDHPKTMASKTTPVFISKIWTVGRAIDAIAQECKIPNNNNVSTALKLRLFKKNTGEIIAENISDKLIDLLSNCNVIDGESLVLEYANDDCKALS